MSSGKPKRLVGVGYWLVFSGILVALFLVGLTYVMNQLMGAGKSRGGFRFSDLTVPAISVACIAALLANTFWSLERSRQIPSGISGQELKEVFWRLRLRLWGALLFLPSVLFCASQVMSRLPIARMTFISFVTDSEEVAEVFLNGEGVGQTPLTMNLDQLKSRFVPGLASATWPPPGVTGATLNTSPGYALNRAFRLPSSGESEGTLFIEERTGTKNLIGALKVKVVFQNGKLGKYVGGGSEWHSFLNQRTEEEILLFLPSP